MRRRVAPLAFVLVAACGIRVTGNAGEGDAGGSAGQVEASSGGGGGLDDDASFGGASFDAPADSPGETVPTLPYAHRQRLRITAGASGLPAGASVGLVFDHAALVNADKARADGNDVRLYRKPLTGPAIELDRVLDPTSAWNAGDTLLWFRVAEPISGQPDASYYLYYGDPVAGPAPADANGVYLFWDGFDGSTLAPGWTAGPIGSASGTIGPVGGMLHFDGATGDIWNQGDDFLFAYRSLSGDFVAEARVAQSGGSLGGWAKVGGLMLRQSADKASRNRIVAPVNGAVALTNSYRTSDGAITDEATVVGANPIPEYVRLDRVGEKSRAFHSDDGKSWSEIGSVVTFGNGLTDPVLLGVPFANLSGSKAQVDVDWIRVRAYVADEPTVARDPEEPGPFTL